MDKFQLIAPPPALLVKEMMAVTEEKKALNHALI